MDFELLLQALNWYAVLKAQVQNINSFDMCQLLSVYILNAILQFELRFYAVFLPVQHRQLWFGELYGHSGQSLLLLVKYKQRMIVIIWIISSRPQLLIRGKLGLARLLLFEGLVLIVRTGSDKFGLNNLVVFLAVLSMAACYILGLLHGATFVVDVGVLVQFFELVLL